MATHSSILAWRIPQTEEPGRLRSMGLLGIGHNWATNTLKAGHPGETVGSTSIPSSMNTLPMPRSTPLQNGNDIWKVLRVISNMKCAIKEQSIKRSQQWKLCISRACLGKSMSEKRWEAAALSANSKNLRAESKARTLVLCLITTGAGMILPSVYPSPQATVLSV